MLLAVTSALRVYAISNRSISLAACTAVLALVPVGANLVSSVKQSRRCSFSSWFKFADKESTVHVQPFGSSAICGLINTIPTKTLIGFILSVTFFTALLLSLTLLCPSRRREYLNALRTLDHGLKQSAVVTILSRMTLIASDIIVLIVTWWQLRGTLSATLHKHNSSPLGRMLLKDSKSTMFVSKTHA